MLDLAGDQTWRGAKRIVELAAGPLPATVAVGDQLAAGQTPVVVMICN